MGKFLQAFYTCYRYISLKVRLGLIHLNIGRFLPFSYHSRYPQRQLMVGYAAYSLLGTVLLCLPFASKVPVTPINNLFSAVSAISTTGLSTVDVATTYTFWGQLIILLLIQMGGIGYMTLSSYVLFGLTHHLDNKKAKIFQMQFSFPDSMKSTNLVRNIINFTFTFELLGFLLLYPYFLLKNVESPLWSAIFHSISSFCTAGFSIYSDNLVRFQEDYYVNGVIIMLGYMGAMGFIMMTDIFRKLRYKKYKISFTTRVIIGVTCTLTLWGTLHLFFFEPLMQEFPVGQRMLTSLFQTMSAMTTVGFNTVDIGQMIPASLLIISIIMYVGASPSGTGGGLKSTTLSAIFAYIRNRLGIRKDISLWNSKIPVYRVETAIVTCLFYTFILLSGVYLIVMLEPADIDFQRVIFEATSALATAGLSSGILTTFGIGSKLVIILLMYIGRVGVITLGNAILAHSTVQKKEKTRNDLVV